MKCGSVLARMIAVAGLSGLALLRSEEHTSELQSHVNVVCRLLLEKKKLDAIIETAIAVLSGLKSKMSNALLQLGKLRYGSPTWTEESAQATSLFIICSTSSHIIS